MVAGGEADLAWLIVGNASSCGLPKSFWSCALAVATCVGSQSTHPRLQGKSPLEVISSHKPSISHLRPFGCVAFAHIDKALRRQTGQLGWEKRSGRVLRRLQLSCYIPARNKVVTTRHAPIATRTSSSIHCASIWYEKEMTHSRSVGIDAATRTESRSGAAARMRRQRAAKRRRRRR